MDVDSDAEKLKSLQLSSLDEEDDEDEAQNDEVEDEISDDDDDEDQIPMSLGFPEKPKNPWSLRRQYFPSKAGGSPVIRRTFVGKIWAEFINLFGELIIYFFLAVFSSDLSLSF